MEKNEKMRNACVAAIQVFEKINKEEYAGLKSKLQYCVGSYDYDKNPSGLIEYGHMALEALKDFKAQNPRKVNKKIIADMEKYLS